MTIVASPGPRHWSDCRKWEAAETKGPSEGEQGPLCLLIQLEVGHTPLEEANGQAGVLGHGLVKCLGVKKFMAHHKFHNLVTSSHRHGDFISQR